MSGKRVSRRKILSRYCADFFVRASFVYVPDVCEEYLAQEIKALATTFLSDLLSRFSPCLSIDKESWIEQTNRERKRKNGTKGEEEQWKEAPFLLFIKEIR